MSLDVSIIIRAKNEAKSIGRCIEAIQAQKTNRAKEIIVVDSGSSDGTQRLATEKGAKVVSLPSENFRFGRSFNAGAEAAGGKYIAVLAAHAFPGDEKWLENLLRNFDDDRTAGVYGRHLPETTHPMEERSIFSNYGTQRKVQTSDHTFSCTNAALRRDLWLDNRFTEDINYNDDFEWAARMQRKGYCIVYEPEAVVYHTHRPSPAQIYARAFNETQSFAYFDPKAQQKDMRAWAVIALIEVLRDWKYTLHHKKPLKYFFLSIPFQFALMKGKRDGYHRGIELYRNN